EGEESEFADLIKSVSVDISPYTVLFGLEQAGLVTRNDGKLELVRKVYSNPENLEESLAMLSQDVDDLIHAVEKNTLDQPKVPNLHITTVFDNICQDDLEKIRLWLLDKGTTFHEEARAYLSKFDKDANPRLFARSGGARVVVSAFSLSSELHG